MSESETRPCEETIMNDYFAKQNKMNESLRIANNSRQSFGIKGKCT